MTFRQSRVLAALFAVSFATLLAAQQPLIQEPVHPISAEPAFDPQHDSAYVSSLTAPSAEVKPAAAPCNCPECQKAAAAAPAELKKAIAGAYKPVFYDNNFSYLNNPAYDQCYFGDALKQIPIGDCWMLDFGGQYRARYHGERNMRGLGLTGNDDDFLLHRTRLFGNAKYGDNLRFYAEYIDAESNYENFSPRSIEVNRSDFLNLFGDWKFHEGERGDLAVRVGRQELIYGNQRLISPLDWANTRRTFDGVKLLWTGEDWNIDGFYTRPVITDDHKFDAPDYDQEFMGLYGTYKKEKDRTLDLYYLRYNNSRGSNGFKYDSLGTRLFVTEDAWMFETECAVQFGENTGGSDHGAGFAMAGIGHKWLEHDWKPVLWANYDWASGGNLQGGRRGFDHLFPLGHKYLGFMDLFGRSNINTPNAQFTCQPHEKLSMMVWYYYFFLDRSDDTPYNVNMSPFAPGVTPGSRDLGHEIDLTLTYTINPRMDVLFGYSHFFSGKYYDTPGLPFRGDADFFYLQYQWNF